MTVMVAGNSIVLALDTSSKTTSMALRRADGVLASCEVEFDDRRAERLWRDIESLLGSVGSTIEDVDLFGVCVGPGSFTGMRVGLAAVKGLATAARRPVVGVTSLEAHAFAAASVSGLVYVLVTAYKGEVYGQLFSFDRDGLPVAENDAVLSTVDAAMFRVEGMGELILAGAGAKGVTMDGHDAWRTAEQPRCLAEHIVRLADLRFTRGEADTPESLRACYVHPAEAEIKLSKGLLGSKIKRVLGREEPAG